MSEREYVRVPGPTALVIAIVVTVSGLVLGCASAPSTGTPSPAPVTVTVGSATDQSLPADFTGLSLEASEISHGDFKGTGLVPFLTTLDPHGLLRIGGNSSDKTMWTSTNEKPPAGDEGVITPASLQAVHDAIAGTGWQVILGVNLKLKQPARAADEASYAHRIFGDQLRAIEVGNESNYYYPTKKPYGTFYADFDAYVAAIRAAVPGIGIAGPDAGHAHPAFVSDFAAHEAANTAITVLTDHHYPLSACGGKTTTIAELLSASSVNNEITAADSAAQAGRADKVPAVMDETNSVTCGGSKNVSNTFASALWVLDYSLLLASHGVVGADFHGGIAGCGSYSPLCAQSGKLVVQTIYYGLLALDQVGSGQFLSVQNPASATLRVYAVRTSAGMSLVLDNVSDPHSAGATSVNVQLGQNFHNATAAALSTSSPDGLAATGQVSVGGNQVKSDGTFPAPTYASIPLSGSTLSVSVPAGSATVVHLS